MKASIQLFFAIMVFSLFISCANKEETPQEFGKSIFEILKDFDSYDKTEFLDEFITYQEFESYLKEGTIQDNNDNKFLLESLEFLKEYDANGKAYDHIKSMSESVAIHWPDITFEEFRLHEDKNTNNIIGGDLDFKSGKYIYTIQVYAYFVEGKHKLWTLKFDDFRL